MKIFLFVGSRRGYAVLEKLIQVKASIVGILCLIEDPHEELYYPKVGVLAKEWNIPVFYSSDIKPAQYADILRRIQPDIAFAIGWRYLIPKEAYEIPHKGTLIMHDSLLPTYRGFAPMNWAIVNGEKETGVTLFYITEEMDAGPIIDQLSVAIDLHDTAKTVDEKIIRLYEDIILKNLPALEAGAAISTPQKEEMATYTCKRTPEDGLIDWRLSAKQIHDLIRGLTAPFPGAYAFLKGKKVIIWSSELPKQQHHYVGNIPGRVIGKREGNIEVLTGEGILQLKELQYVDEEKKMASEFAVSVKDTFGGEHSHH